MRLILKKLSVNLPWGIGGVKVDLSEEAERAAWILYVELNTRIATVPLEGGEGSIRGALESLHSLFNTTRDVLRKAGVDVARAESGNQSLGLVAMAFLNQVVRPFLVKWHTQLSAYEASVWHQMIENGRTIPSNAAVAKSLINEAAWDQYDRFYDELKGLQNKLSRYSGILGSFARVVESEDVTAVEGS